MIRRGNLRMYLKMIQVQYLENGKNYKMYWHGTYGQTDIECNDNDNDGM